MPVTFPSACTAATVASSTRLMQSHRKPPAAVRRCSARWPMANLGSVPMPMRPGPSGWTVLRWLRRSSCSVVQRCPCHPMYWRSSEQMRQCSGGMGVSGYWVPQVVQMKFAIPVN